MEENKKIKKGSKKIDDDDEFEDFVDEDDDFDEADFADEDEDDEFGEDDEDFDDEDEKPKKKGKAKKGKNGSKASKKRSDTPKLTKGKQKAKEDVPLTDARLTGDIEHSNRKMRETEEMQDTAPESQVDPSLLKPSIEGKTGDYKSVDVTSVEEAKFDPNKDAPWTKGQKAPFFFVSSAFEMIAQISGAASADKKKKIMANIFKAFQWLSPDEVANLYLFSTGRLDAEYIQEDLGVGKEILMRAAIFITKKTKEALQKEMKEKGELGEILEDFKGTKGHFNNQKRLTFEYVFSEIRRLTKVSGQTEKEGIIRNLIYDATGVEIKYIFRFLNGGHFKMACGKTAIQACLAKAIYEFFKKGGTDGKEIVSDSNELKDWEKALHRCNDQYPNYRFIVKAMQESKGDPGYLNKHCKLTAGIPCKPMLAKPMKNIHMIFNRFEGKPFTCEYKYDGLRGQIHYNNGDIQIYSRNLENMTHQYPDVIKNIREGIKPETRNIIIDSEIVATDQKNGRVLPFQVLAGRKKKGVTLDNIQQPVCVYLFDCLYFNDENLLEKTLAKRRESLRAAFTPLPAKISFVVSKEAEDFDAIQGFLDESVLSK